MLKQTEATPSGDVVAAVRAAAARELPALVQKIDSEGYYPESVLREFGRLGAFAHHLPGGSDNVNLVTAINAMAAAGEYCLSTSFCMWCQDAFAWYIFASANETLKKDLGRRAACGEALGGTALSNPMKTFFGIEPMRLKGERIGGGYRRQRSAAVRLQSRRRSLFRRHIRSRRRRPQTQRDGDFSVRRRGIEPVGKHQVRGARRHAHFFGADARCCRSRFLGHRRPGRRVRQTHPRRLRPAASRHGVRSHPRLHQTDATDQRPARPRQQISRCPARGTRRTACRHGSRGGASCRNAL